MSSLAPAVVIGYLAYHLAPRESQRPGAVQAPFPPQSDAARAPPAIQPAPLVARPCRLQPPLTDADRKPMLDALRPLVAREEVRYPYLSRDVPRRRFLPAGSAVHPRRTPLGPSVAQSGIFVALALAATLGLARRWWWARMLSVSLALGVLFAAVISSVKWQVPRLGATSTPPTPSPRLRRGKQGRRAKCGQAGALPPASGVTRGSLEPAIESHAEGVGGRWVCSNPGAASSNGSPIRPPVPAGWLTAPNAATNQQAP